MGKRDFLKALAVAACCAWGLPALAADASEPADGYVAIHYYRADANYAGWGLHAWSRIPGGQDTPLDGIGWLSPLKPMGKEEDGSVFWHLKLADFGKRAQVFYIIHKGDSKEQGGKDQNFDGAKIRQVWVNQGDPALYTSKDEALKARTK